jgi:hypothetical protein
MGKLPKNPLGCLKNYLVHIGPGSYYQLKGRWLMADQPLDLPMSEFSGDEIGQFDEEAITSSIVSELRSGMDSEAIASAVRAYIIYGRLQKRWALKEKGLSGSRLTKLYASLRLFLNPAKPSAGLALACLLALMFGLEIMNFLLNTDIGQYFIANRFFVSMADYINSLLPMAQTVINRSAMSPEKTSIMLAYGGFLGFVSIVMALCAYVPYSLVNQKTVVRSARVWAIYFLLLLVVVLLVSACFWGPYRGEVSLFFYGRHAPKVSLTRSLLGPGSYAATISLYLSIIVLFIKFILFQRRLPAIRRRFERLARLPD